ncbi:hypothetical protein CARUB_v10028660mg [Capsella rubella]|uniref:Uncharacterized protein n=1 Tax=Capsella rubella TaxID=81985 RepID=R0F1T4_9BRAS|nr:hypothetical protein CARUB_v10028660mg [Capsella rubella]
MEKITKEERRSSRCLPSFRSIYRSKSKSKKEAAAAKTKVEAEVIIAKHEEMMKIENCWEGGKSPVEYGSNISEDLLGEEVTDEETEEEVEVSFICKEEDRELQMVMVVVEDNKSNSSNENSSLLDKEVITGEGSMEMADDKCDKVLAIHEILKVVENEKVEKGEEESTDEQGSDNVDGIQEPIIPIPIKQAITPPIYVPSQPPSHQYFPYRHPNMYQNSCGRTRSKKDGFHKVKTFDLIGVIKSSDKGSNQLLGPDFF